MIKSQLIRPEAIDAQLGLLLVELTKRKMEGLRLFRHLPMGLKFRQCDSKWRICDGSNRSSKTTTTVVEFCEAVCGCSVPGRYPLENGNSMVVGWDLEHNAMLWRKCYEPGAFKMIRDEHYPHEWRAVRPDPRNPRRLDPYDLAYKEKWKDAPPLIPRHMIKAIAWEDKAKGIPRFVSFKTGWKAIFRSSDSASKAPQGDAYHLVLIDEELGGSAGFFSEIVRGLTGVDPRWKPRGIWSATHHVGTPELIDLRERAERGDKEVSVFTFLIEDNPYIPPEEKAEFAASLDREQYAMRIQGVSIDLQRLVYPMFQISLHTCEPFAIPEDWTRFIVVDYAIRHCGTLFIAVDPEEKHMWVYDGFDLQNSDAATWASLVKEKQGGHKFEAAIGDAHMGRDGRIGSGESVAQWYWQALVDAGVRTRLMGSDYRLGGFFPGMDVIEARTEALISMMLVRTDGPFAGTPKLQIFRGRIPELERQIARAQYADMRKLRSNTPVRKKMVQDLLDCLEYAAAFKPYYCPPAKIEQEVGNSVYRKYLEFKRHQERKMHGHVSLMEENVA